MQKKTIKYFTATLLLSSTLFFTGCVPTSTLYNHSYNGYSTGRYIGIYDYPRYLDAPYYFYNNRYYYGGYYQNGYYQYRDHRYRDGRYYHRGYRYHHRRHKDNVHLLRRDDHSTYSRDHYYKDKRSKRSSRSERNRNRNVHLLRR